MQYELAVLYHPDAAADLKLASEKIKTLITRVEGKIVDTEEWGMRKLAYKIDNQVQAVYVFYTLELDTQAVKPLDAALNITTEVIRHMITRIDPKDLAKVEKLKVALDKHKARKASKSDQNNEDKPKTVPETNEAASDADAISTKPAKTKE